MGTHSDLAAIAAVCREHEVVLVVDEAHGAHFGLLPELPRNALQCGADISVQSTHKVLGAMTQAAMLHVQGPRVSHKRVSSALQVLQSSSPSYILMGSLDAARLQVDALLCHPTSATQESFLHRGLRCPPSLPLQNDFNQLYCK